MATATLVYDSGRLRISSGLTRNRALRVWFVQLDGTDATPSPDTVGSVFIAATPASDVGDEHPDPALSGALVVDRGVDVQGVSSGGFMCAYVSVLYASNLSFGGGVFAVSRRTSRPIVENKPIWKKILSASGVTQHTIVDTPVIRPYISRVIEFPSGGSISDEDSALIDMNTNHYYFLDGFTSESGIPYLLTGWDGLNSSSNGQFFIRYQLLSKGPVKSRSTADDASLSIDVPALGYLQELEAVDLRTAPGDQPGYVVKAIDDLYDPGDNLPQLSGP